MKLTNTSTLEELIVGCKAGQRSMQEQLYKQTVAKMFAICMRYSKDRATAEDAMQNGYVKIFNNIHSYRNEGSAEGWIKRIMVNSAIESYRNSVKSLSLVQLEEVHDLPSTGFDLNSLGMEDLLRLVQQLADGYRMVFNMFAIEGYSHKEIAVELGISEATSKSQLSRARSILKQEILKMEGTHYATYTG